MSNSRRCHARPGRPGRCALRACKIYQTAEACTFSNRHSIAVQCPPPTNQANPLPSCCPHLPHLPQRRERNIAMQITADCHGCDHGIDVSCSYHRRSAYFHRVADCVVPLWPGMVAELERHRNASRTVCLIGEANVLYPFVAALGAGRTLCRQRRRFVDNPPICHLGPICTSWLRSAALEAARGGGRGKVYTEGLCLRKLGFQASAGVSGAQRPKRFFPQVCVTLRRPAPTPTPAARRAWPGGSALARCSASGPS